MKLAAAALEAPAALVCLATSRGLSLASRTGTSRRISQRALSRSQPLWNALVAARTPFGVPDVATRVDLRDDPLLQALGARACAVAPLLTAERGLLGALCVLGFEAREWTARDLATLEAVAAGCAAEISRRREAAEREATAQGVAALQEAIARTLGSMPLELVLTDRRGRYLYLTSSIVLDPSLRTLLLGGTDVDYCAIQGFSPAIARARRRAIRSAVRERHLVELEETLLDQAGKARHFARFVAPLPEADGRVRRVLSVGVEITRRKQFEAALQASEARYRHLVEQASDMIYQTDASGRFTYVNPVFCRLTGYSAQQLVGMHFVELLPPAYRRTLEDFYNEQGRTLTPNTYREFPSVTLNGRVLWVGQNVQLLLEAGEVVGTQGVARDITEHREAEAALRAGEARTHAILEASLDAIVTVGSDGRVVEFNPAAEAIFGYPRAEVIGKPAPELIATPELREALERALANPESIVPESLMGRRLEATALRADGREFLVELALAPTRDEHGNFAFTAFVRDITPRKQAEAALIETRNAAEAATRAKSALLRTMTHELRTPMNAILGAAELLLDGGLDADGLELASMVETNARGLLVLLNAFLDSAKLEAGQLEIEDAPFDPRDVLDDVAETLAPAAGAKGLELLISADPQLPTPLLGDPLRIRQVLVNLGDNAVKFTQHGEVSIHTDLRSCPDGQELHFSVKDTGIGISPADQARIFEPFTQVSADADRGRGTGLGLGISRSLAQLMGGRLELESQPAGGSTFHLFLPLRPAKAGTLVPGAHLFDVQAIVVALPGSLRNMIVGVLRRAGADVTEVSREAEAMDILENLDPPGDPVIISDDHVPDYPGLELLARRMSRHTGRRCRLVVLCAPDSAEAALRPKPGRMCVPRPVRPRGLIRAVEQVLARRRGSSLRPATLRTHLPRARTLGARILLVEDSVDDRIATRRVLAAAGFAVDAAWSGERAVVMAATGQFDLILMDLDLPGLDGFGATRAIRAAELEAKRSRVPIVALTGYSRPEIRQNALACGMDGFLTKPVDTHRLVDAITRAMKPPPAILVAEDAPDERALIQRWLAENYYQLVFVADGRAAVEAFERQSFSLALLDVEMPLLDGCAAVRAIRSLANGSVLPIIAISGHDRADFESHCLEAGFTAYLEKPVRRGELRRLVRNSLQATTLAGLGPGRTGQPRRPEREDGSGALTRVLPAGVGWHRRPPRQPAESTESSAGVPNDGRAPESQAPVPVAPHLADLVPQFLENRRADAERIARLLKGAAFQEICRIGHNMKSCCAGYGFPAASEMGRELEAAAEARDSSRVLAIARRLQEHLADVSWTVGET